MPVLPRHIDETISHRLLPQTIGTEGQTVAIEGGQIVYKTPPEGNNLSRTEVSVTTASLADLAEETGTVALGKQAIVSIVSADKACRVRLYPTAAARTADSSRELGEAIEEGDEEPLLEDSLTASKLTNSSPAATVFNGDGSPSSDIYYAIQNRSGSTGTVEVTFTVLILEV